VPRYYFDISDGDVTTTDTEGQEMSIDEARQEAIGVLPQLAKDVLPDGDTRTFVSYVRDEEGSGIFRAKLTLRAEWLIDPSKR